MSDYTPTTNEMLDGYVTMRRREIPGDRVLASVQALGEAERWLAAHDAEALSEHDRQVAERAWDEGQKAGLLRADFEYGAIGYQHVRGNPYRAAKGEQ